MPKSFIRKDKIILENCAENNNTVTVTLNIDSNHINNNLDQLLQSITTLVNTFPNYKVHVPEPKEKKQPKKSKNNGFKVSGNFV